MRFTSTFAVVLLGSVASALSATDSNNKAASVVDHAQLSDYDRAFASLLDRRASDGHTTKTVDSGNTVTISKSMGTTGDKKGYNWKPIGSVAGLARRQLGKDNTVVDNGNVVKVSKAQGTTKDRKGYSWQSVGL